MLRYVAGAAASFVTYAGYASMAPRSQFLGHTFTHGEDPQKLALTYDDGPNDPHTLHLLDILAEHNVRATFFVIGRYAARRPDILRRIAREGHIIGNHTYSHPNLIFSTRTAMEQEIDDCAKVISGAVGAHSNLFRPPFGGRRPGVLRTIRRKGLSPVMWSVTCYDWADSTTAEAIEWHAHRQIRRRGGNVILLHDGSHKGLGADRRYTVEATRRIISSCRREGYEFATVSELIEPQSMQVAPVGAGAVVL